MPDTINILSPALGCDFSRDLLNIGSMMQQPPSAAVEWVRNGRFAKSKWRNRHTWHELPLSGDDLNEWQDSPTQACIPYVRKSGAGLHYQASGGDGIVEMSAGAMWKIALDPDEDGALTVTKVATVPQPGQTSLRDLGSVNLIQAENYVIATGGQGTYTLIWDGQSSVVVSPGYNAGVPTASKIPNAAGPLAYVNGRLWVSRYGRQVLVGDLLHSLNQREALDILGFTDQVYNDTGRFFAAPADHGDIRGIGRATLSGQSPLAIVHSERGILGIHSGIPRSQWVDTSNMQVVLSDETSATGPWAFSQRDSRHLFRSDRGVEMLRLVVSDEGGTSYTDLARSIRPLLHGDNPEFLDVCSLVNPSSFDRMMLTVQPCRNGPAFWHNAALTCNWNPAEKIQAGGFAWEGTFVPPAAFGKLVQLVEGTFGRRQRVFAITLDPATGRKRLIEATKQDGDDIAADGTHLPIEWGIKTSGITFTDGFAAGGMQHGVLRFTDIQGKVGFKVWCLHSEDQWRLVREGEVNGPDAIGGEAIKPLGVIAGRNTPRHFQLYFQFTGCASVDFAFTPGQASSVEQEDMPPRIHRSEWIPSPYSPDFPA